jgi:hypothetical protein
MEKMYCGSRPLKSSFGGLLVDVIHLRGAELLRFLVGLGGIGRLQLNARAGGGLGGALALFFGRLGGAGNLRNADLQMGNSFSTTSRCWMTDLNSL